MQSACDTTSQWPTRNYNSGITVSKSHAQLTIQTNSPSGKSFATKQSYLKGLERREEVTHTHLMTSCMRSTFTAAKG